MKMLLLTGAFTFIFSSNSLASTCDAFLNPSSKSNVTNIYTHILQFQQRTKSFKNEIQNLARKSLSFKTDLMIPVTIPTANIELLHVVEDNYVKVRRAQFIQSLYELDSKLQGIAASDRPHAFVSLLMQRRSEVFELIRDLDKVTFDRVNAFYANDFDDALTDSQEIEFDKRLQTAKENLLEEDQIVEAYIHDVMVSLMDETFR